MKRLLLASVGLLALGASAGAADVPRKMVTKAPPPAAVAPVPAFTWTGCYLGGHVGGGWGRKDWSNATGFELSNSEPVFGGSSSITSLSRHVSGFLGGAQAGCKYEFAPNWVVGLDGEFSAAHIVSTTSLNANNAVFGNVIPVEARNETDWLASTTANLGYSFNRLLLYAKGGAAWAHDKYSFLATPGEFFGVGPADFEARETRTGWTAGAGIEYPFWRNFSAKIEYDFYGFGTRNVHFADQLSSPPSPGNADIRQHIHAIKFGINYYFWNAAAPAPPPPTGMVTKAPIAAPAVTPPAIIWSETFASEVRYFTWQSNRGIPNNVILLNSTPLTTPGRGAELYIPYASQLVGQSEDFKVEILGRGGWVWARQSTEGLTGEVATATDTVTSGTVTYLGLQGIQPFASINLNLPTGLATLPVTAIHARMDPDLVDIATFGEGFNIGPTLGFNLPLTNSFIVTMSAGYTKRGTFERESALTPPQEPGAIPTTIEPGDVFTVTSSVGSQVGQLSSKITGTITEDTTTRENGMPFVRPGTRYVVAGTWSYAWPFENVGVTTLTASASHANRSEVLFVFPGAPTSLVTEPFNTNSNLYRVGLEHLFTVGQVAFGPTGSFLFRDHNGYDPTTVQFMPAKERWSAGVLARYAPNETVVFNARVEHVWTHEDENPATINGKFSVLANGNLLAFTVPVISSTGWQFAVGATAKF